VSLSRCLSLFGAGAGVGVGPGSESSGLATCCSAHKYCKCFQLAHSVTFILNESAPARSCALEENLSISKNIK